jgi:hypothetical protein
MTTTITVQTAGHRVEVKTKDATGERDYTVSTEILEPDTTKIFYAHQQRSFKITELPNE